jgi:osmotically-inducible protein OsmY
MRSSFKVSMSQLIIATALSTQLTGCFPIIAGGAAAGGAMVADRRTAGTYVEDQSIELKAEKLIFEKIGKDIHANVTSYNRNVLITGEAKTSAVKANAEDLVKPINQVNKVTNELVIGENSSLTSRSNDAYITSKVKASFVKENKFPANYVKVVTEASTVFLLGMVTQQEADDAVEIARGVSGVEKVVKVFEYIK